MTASPRAPWYAGIAGVIVVALALHVLMLAGVTVTGIAEDGGHAVTVAHVTQDDGATIGASAAHPVHGHLLLVDCMAVLAALGLAALLVTERRVVRSQADQPPPTRPAPRTQRGAHAPPGPLVTHGVLLRV